MQSNIRHLPTLLEGICQVLLRADFVELAVDQRITQRIVASLDRGSQVCQPAPLIARQSLGANLGCALNCRGWSGLPFLHLCFKLANPLGLRGHKSFQLCISFLGCIELLSQLFNLLP